MSTLSRRENLWVVLGTVRTLPDFPLIMVTRLLRMQNYPTHPVAICKLHTSHRTCFCRRCFNVIPFKQTQNLRVIDANQERSFFKDSTSWAQWYQCFSHLLCGVMSCTFAGHQALYIPRDFPDALAALLTLFQVLSSLYAPAMLFSIDAASNTSQHS